MSHHADSLALPPLASKHEFYTHVAETLSALLSPSPPPTVDHVAGNWITSLSNCSSLLMGCFENFDQVWGRKNGKRVNWCGFYVLPSLVLASSTSTLSPPQVLLLGPFQGRPACLEVALVSPSSRPVGVCASSYLQRKTVLVADVENHPGHISCDGVTKSEIVVPLIGRNKVGEEVVFGVLDVDCEALDGFSDEDVKGLELIVEVLIKLVRWDS